MKKLNVILCLMAILFTYQTQSQTIVERHGQLSVQSGKIVDQCGRPTQLRGMSYFFHYAEGNQHWNEASMRWIRDDWKVQIFRAPIWVSDRVGYFFDREGAKNQMRTVVNAAVNLGVYIIVDWHAHNKYTSEAKAFFDEMSREFAGIPNVIYEIWNEPIGTYEGSLNFWRNEITPYAKELISTIRNNDPDNLIIVPTPFYDQFVQHAANEPVLFDSRGNPTSNIAYTLHIYANQHGYVRPWAEEAVSKGIALFATEGNARGTNFNDPGNNPANNAEWDKWLQFYEDNYIGFCKWSLSDKNEDSSSLWPSAQVGGPWTDSNLREEGKVNRPFFRRVNANPPPLCDGGGDALVNISSPNSVSPGTTVSITIEYTATTNRDIVVVFQEDNGNFTPFGEGRSSVSEGIGTVTVSVPISPNTPIANDNYQFQTFITSQGGGWDQRIVNEVKTNVDCIAGGGNQGDTLVISARGNCGSETMVLEVNGTDVRTWTNVSSTISDYTYTNYPGGTVKIKFTNDGNNGCDRNLFVDNVSVGNTIYQTENTATRTGCGDTQWLWCNGNFNFGDLRGGSSSGNIIVRARGNCGSESFQLRVDGNTVLTETVNTSYATYSYPNYTSGIISVHFTNDTNVGCDRNLYIDYIDVCGTTIQSESSNVVQTSNYTNGDKQILFTNGNNNYGNPGCSSLSRSSKNLFVNTSMLYPNPTQGVVYIQGHKGENLAIFSINGIKILEENILTNNYELNVSRLKPGLYLVKSGNKSKGTESSSRLIIE